MKEQWKHPLLDETLIKRTHESGLEVWMIPKPDFQGTHASFFVQYGSNQNRYKAEGTVWDMPEGIAHFLEHKIFESSEENIFNVFASQEASVNAYTNFVSTCYHFNATDRLDKNLDTLLRFVQNPMITPENVEKEKGIIAQEIRMYEDNPDWRVYFNTLKALYSVHPVRTDIAGTVESIGRITADDLLKAYGHWYTPKRMKVFAIGSLDPDQAFETVQKALEPAFLKRNHLAEEVLDKEPEAVASPWVEEEFSVPVPIFFIGIKDLPGFTPEELTLKTTVSSLVMDVLFGRSSELYQRLTEKGLINGSYGSEFSAEPGYAHGILGGESTDPEQVHQIVRDFLKNEAQQWIRPSEIERVKRKTLGRFLQMCNSLEGLGRTTVSLLNRGITPFDYFDCLQNLTLKQVEDCFEIMKDESRMTVSVVRSRK
jgi:predicted Zn-dependent peptidase